MSFSEATRSADLGVHPVADALAPNPAPVHAAALLALLAAAQGDRMDVRRTDR